MSRDVWDELESPDADTLGYKQGEENLEDVLALIITRAFLTEASLADVINFHPEKYLRNRIENADEFDAQVFIDGVVSEMEMGVGLYGNRVEYLMEPLIRILYDLDRDSLFIDYRHAYQESVNYWDIGRGLKGSRERPLTLHYAVPEGSQRVHLLRSLMGAQDCDVVIEGYAGEVARGAMNCTFTINGRLESLGWGRENCDFYFPLAKQGEYVGNRPGSDSPAIKLTYEDWEGYVCLKDREFFKTWNFFYIPDGSDGWKQVMTE